MKRFKSVSRAIRRGHLRINYKPIFTKKFEDIGNPTTGSQLVPKMVQVPFLERRSSRNRKVWLKY